MRFNPKKKSKVNVLGLPMAYVESGKGDPIILLHGNPTSSYLWRKVIPELSGLGRCIAPDLIGMGDSAKSGTGPNAYRFKEHREYMEAFLSILGVDENVTLVGHDWGGPLLFDWGRRNPGAVKAVIYMETIVTPLTWDDWPESARDLFRAMRSEAGEEIVLQKNVFIEKILPASVLEPLSEETMKEYRRPYLAPGESRRPTLTWPREIPLDGQPADVHETVSKNEKWLHGPDVPKLFVNADPGSILTGRQREACRKWDNQFEVTVPGIHFIQEDSGEAIGRYIASFLKNL
ncbi:MAG: haloalkane dehalogenase [Acidimicrobiia bacterium]|nr:haloalkane dehalogenase [Acidimicrobiia bacterium]MDH3462782.1 haloalkane dehalogenase [Acidimicrobiia bacterium]